MSQNAEALQRSARLYPYYALCSSANFWQPVFFLYFIQYLSLAEVLRLEAVYYMAVVVLEVPSGYFSDVVGRRVTLIISAASTVVASSLFLIGDSFSVFACAQIALAAGMAFRSGTDTSFHYDVLSVLNRESEYDHREAVVARNAFAGSALAALIGGLVASYALHLAYVLSVGVAIVAFMIALLFAEPSQQRVSSERVGFISQIGHCLRYLHQPALAWLMVFVIFMTVINHIPYEFYQPYIGLLHFQDLMTTPVVTGFHTAITLMVASWIAGYSIRLRDVIGLPGALLLAAGLQTLIIGLMALYIHLFVALFLLLRSSPRALMAAPLNAAVVPRLEAAHRATYLSIQSLLGRLAFSGALMTLSVYAGQDTNWAVLSHTLTLCVGFALVGFVMLILTVRFVLGDSAQVVGQKDSV